MRSLALRASLAVSVLAVASATSPATSASGVSARSERTGPTVRGPERHDLSPRLDAIARTFKPPARRDGRDLQMPEGVLNNGGAAAPQPAVKDPVVQDWTVDNVIPAPEFSFEGLNNDDNFNTLGVRVTPPDTNGDIGPNHYVQTVNLVFAVYNRAGTRLLGPLPNRAVFTGFGGVCETRNDGDPIVLYDHLADRWLLSQFTTASPFHQCIAISQTPDPTGAWFRYDYVIPSGRFNDYPKFGVWPDGYYMSASSRGIPGPQTDVFAFERDLMLTGGAARMVTFVTDATLGYVTPMPADLDGPPPPAGAPNTFVGIKQSIPQAMYLFRFHVDWTNVANSTFGLNGLPNDTLSSIAPFTLICPTTRNCIPQPASATGLDALAGRYVMYRAQYRNFGTHESIVFNQTVDAGGSRAGVRWYEVRDPAGAPVIHQQGTFAPADGVHRWMGSAAMDRLGNFAVGYSASSSTVSPSIFYAGRLATDPLGELAQGEAVMIAGSGSQTSTGSRWGDYSMMAVDPVDDCTFWYTTEYYAVTSTNGWQSRIGRFRFPNCVTDDFTVSANPSTLSVPRGASATTTVTIQSVNGFSSQVDLDCPVLGTSGLTCTFNPPSVTPPPGLSVTSTLTVTASATRLTVTACAPSVLELSPGSTMRRSRIPERSVIHSSVVSTIRSRSALVSTRLGRWWPTPVIWTRARAASEGVTRRPVQRGARGACGGCGDALLSRLPRFDP